MSIREWGFAYAITNLLQRANKKGKIKDLANAIDRVIDQRFPKRSENIQAEIVRQLLLPISKELLTENPALLLQIVHKFVDELDKQYKSNKQGRFK